MFGNFEVVWMWNGFLSWFGFVCFFDNVFVSCGVDDNFKVVVVI